MKEELYVYTSSGERRELKLGSDSGITLKWASNIFNSLDKVNCSYSYTFKVPVTRHNAEALDLADDVRHTSGMVRRKVKADFIQNGIPLFTNANLYVNQVSNGNYQCVFTFNVLDELQTVKDDGCDLNEIGEELKKTGVDVDWLVSWGSDYLKGNPVGGYGTELRVGKLSLFDNRNTVLWPMYCAGICNQGVESLHAPLPVVPTRFLLKSIETLYGLKFDLPSAKYNVAQINSFKEEDKYDFDNLVSYGCVPLIGTELTKAQEEGEAIYANGAITYGGRAMMFGIRNLITFTSMKYSGVMNMMVPSYVKVFKSDGQYRDYAMPYNDDITEYLRTSPPPTEANLWRFGGVCAACEVEMRGSIRVRTETEILYDSETGNATDETLLKMKIYRLNHWNFSRHTILGGGLTVSWNYWTSKEESQVEPPEGIVLELGKGDTFAQNHYDANHKFMYAEYYFCFDPDLGFDAITFGVEGTDDVQKSPDIFHHYLIGFSYTLSDWEVMTPIRFVPHISDCKKLTHKVDAFKNLPEISCLDFIKSLYYMAGAFPKVNSDGSIGAVPYARLRENIQNGNVNDWSKKVIGTVVERPEETSYKVGDFAQKNYYLSKWDNLDRTEEDLEEEDDIYEDGYSCIVSDNEYLTDEQTVYTLPYYPPHIKNRKMPYRWVGDSVKFWELSDGEYNYSACQPCYGILSSAWPRRLYNYDMTTWKTTESSTVINTASKVASGDNVLWMDVLNPFADMSKNPNWAYVQEIVKDPIMVTEKMLLNEMDLRDIDFSKPVYLEKYNSCFAIVTIQRDSKGVCKCELIKLPNE